MNSRNNIITIIRILVVMTLLGGLLQLSNQPAGATTQIDIYGPVGSAQFGKSVTLLPNGNFVVADPLFSIVNETNVGAVYLFDGTDGQPISMLIGTTANDQVGSGGVTVLSNGNFVVSSPNWSNSAAAYAGAVTWGSSTSGVSGVVSNANSLVGSTVGDGVGEHFGAVTSLANGNYVVGSPDWHNGGVSEAGAATWGNGTSGISGWITSDNSLLGSYHDDWVGYRVTPLSNGNYLVTSNNNCIGAVTWGNGTTGITGTISAANSLVGSTCGDYVGGADVFNGVTELANGNYLVNSPNWSNGAAAAAGAVTWGNGAVGVTGVVSITNSLVGSTIYDEVGCQRGILGGCSDSGLTLLANGNYVVSSASWDNGAVVDAGAVTWGNGVTGVTGVVSVTNSLVGSTASDQVGYVDWNGSGGVTALSNGSYMVSIPTWDNGAATDAGAVTWENGESGISGTVSVANSLVGSISNDRIGSGGVTALANGNYVVNSSYWNNSAGAVTWGNGANGSVGAISDLNSLVGGNSNENVGNGGVTALANGNYVVDSSWWNSDTVLEVGAITWGSGESGITGTVSAANSLVGSKSGDQVGSGGVKALANGNYVVKSPYWDNGAVMDAGAVTCGDGTSGVSGVVSSANSLVGSSMSDEVSSGGVTALTNGNYVVSSYLWDNGAATDAGAVTWGSGTGGIHGVVSAANSLVGSSINDEVGHLGVTALTNGDYVVDSPWWDNGVIDGVGAVTWGNGASGITSTISAVNSLVGSTDGDVVGSGGVTALSNGNYVVSSPYWDNGAVTDAGAVTWSYGPSGTFGPITINNSVGGTITGGGAVMVFQYDPVNDQLVVGRWAEEMVTLFNKKTFPGTFGKSSPIDGTTGISSSPTLVWGTSAETTSYEYCYDTTNDNACNATWINNGTATSADLSGLSLSTTYYWQVRAVNGEATIYANNGTWWSFTTAPYLNYLSLVVK